MFFFDSVVWGVIVVFVIRIYVFLKDFLCLIYHFWWCKTQTGSDSSSKILFVSFLICRSTRRRRSTEKIPPIVTNTALTVLKLCGKYLHMMQLLSPVAFDVMLCITQLFDYFLYTIHLYFVQSMVGTMCILIKLPCHGTVVWGQSIIKQNLTETHCL